MNVDITTLMTVSGVKDEIHPQKLEEDIIDLVELAVKAKGDELDEPLLPARYHTFIRSIEGAFVQFYPKVNFSVESKKYDEETKYPFFELGVCESCGQPHIIGEEINGKLVQQQNNQADENVRFFAYMIINRIDNENVYDEDEELLEGEHSSENILYDLCPCCSSITIKGEDTIYCCLEAKNVKKLLLRKEAVQLDKQAKCNNCGKRSSNPIRQFVLGQDGATSVLSTSLYQQLVKGGERVENLNQEQPISLKDSRFSFLAEDEKIKKDNKNIYDPQKLLIFSDSRQSAAYFSPYLESTYKHILWKNLLYTVLIESEEQYLSVETLASKMIQLAEKHNIFNHGMDRTERKKVAQQYVMRELIKGEERNSLEGVGLINIQVELPQKFYDNKDQLGSQFGLSGDKTINLLNILFDSFRYYNAIQHPNESDPKDETFFPKNRQVSINKSQSQTKANILSWLPTGNHMNKRINYLMRVYNRKGFSEEKSKEKAKTTLEDIWNYFIATDQILSDFFIGYKGNKIMSYKYWRISKIENTYRCDTCGTLTSKNVSDVCSKNNCVGKLEIFKPRSIFNHYRKLYENIIPTSMTVREHTAQLSPETAMNYQDSFIKGNINVLSCSTTFEMGVDVGDLESVFMRNVPPDTANYIQRAGRAGRRKSSVAFVLTYANRRSHDLTFYEKPEDMIAGIVKPPIFKMDNPKIIQRHVNSIILSQFFRENPVYFGKVNKFFLDQENTEVTGEKLLTDFLMEKPPTLLQSIKNIVPNSSKSELSLKSWNWSKDLMISDKHESLLHKVATMYYDNLSQLKQLADRNYHKGSGSVDMLRRLIKTHMTESLISYFSKHNILPKYGFPVDVVEMQIIDKEADKIRLNRDLTMAISEYAPGSQIIANGNIFESTGLRFIRGFELTRKYYTECKSCKRYNILKENDPNYNEKHAICESCNDLIPVHKMIVPSFGFVATKKGKAGERKPLKEFRSRVFFSEYDFSGETHNKEEEKKEELKDFSLYAKYSPFGKLAVVNNAKGKGYHLCNNCGSVVKSGKKKPSKHKKPSGGECSGKYDSQPIHLGHEFMSDVLEIHFEGQQIHAPEDLLPWESLLYAILNGASSGLGIDRNDIDGVVHRRKQMNPSIILYDKVPGGAGYMKEIYENLHFTLNESLSVLEMCSCGLETSCYGCLKNYLNQHVHDYLSRGTAIEMLKTICANLEGNYAVN